MKKASRSATPKWTPSTSPAMRSIRNGTTQSNPASSRNRSRYCSGCPSIARGSPDHDVPSSTAKVQGPLPSAPTINMVAPSGLNGAWTAPPQSNQRTDGGPVRPVRAAATPDLAQTMLSLRDRLPKLGTIPGIGDGRGIARQAPVVVPEGARFEERTFSNAAGSRTYKVYVPSGYR